MVIKKENLYRSAICFLFGAFVVLFVMIPVVFADTGDGFPEYMLTTINEGVISTIQTNLTSGGFFDLMVGADGQGTSSVVTTMMNLIYPIALAVLIITCSVKYYENIERGGDPKETFYKSLVSVCLIGVLALNVDGILGLAARGGILILDMAADAVAASAASDVSVSVAMSDIAGADSGGIIWWIKSVMILIIPWILTLIMQVVAQFIGFSLLIELGVRRAFSPVIVAEIYGEGMRSPGVRYLKRYLATFIKIAICLIVCGLGLELMGVALNEMSSSGSLLAALQYVFRVIAINFTVLGVMAKTGEYANDIVGA